MPLEWKFWVYSVLACEAVIIPASLIEGRPYVILGPPLIYGLCYLLVAFAEWHVSRP